MVFQIIWRNNQVFLKQFLQRYTFLPIACCLPTTNVYNMLTDRKRIWSILLSYRMDIFTKPVNVAYSLQGQKAGEKRVQFTHTGILPKQFILGIRTNNDVLKTPNLLFLNGQYHLREGSLFSFVGRTTSTGFPVFVVWSTAV